MSRFTVNLNDPPPGKAEAKTQIEEQESQTSNGNAPKTGRRSDRLLRVLKILGAALFVILLVVGIGSFLYWQSVKKSPAYSLALLVDAARRDDQKQVEQLVDTEAVVGNFMPQVTAKAVELYGRNLSPAALAKVEQVAAPAIPIIKERAKMELPRVIREKTEAVEKVPYWVIALFADRAVSITLDGDTANVKSTIPERPLELTMKRDAATQTWKVIGMKDDVLARKIAEKIGQEIIAVASKGGLKKAAQQLGVKDLDSLKNMDIFK